MEFLGPVPQDQITRWTVRRSRLFQAGQIAPRSASDPNNKTVSPAFKTQSIRQRNHQGSVRMSGRPKVQPRMKVSISSIHSHPFPGHGEPVRCRFLRLGSLQKFIPGNAAGIRTEDRVARDGGLSSGPSLLGEVIFKARAMSRGGRKTRRITEFGFAQSPKLMLPLLGK